MTYPEARIPEPDKCPLARQYGDTVCRDGMLWGLTYSEMAPPDSRQCLGECNWPGHSKPEARIPETPMQIWTPGPWFIGDTYCDDEGHPEIPIHASNGRGGECTPASVVLQFPTVEGMQEANARLISAAPTMADYIKRRSDLGDIDATEIWEQIVQ